jgi:hypothetical protein
VRGSLFVAAPVARRMSSDTIPVLFVASGQEGGADRFRETLLRAMDCGSIGAAVRLVGECFRIERAAAEMCDCDPALSAPAC